MEETNTNWVPCLNFKASSRPAAWNIISSPWYGASAPEPYRVEKHTIDNHNSNTSWSYKNLQTIRPNANKTQSLA